MIDPAKEPKLLTDIAPLALDEQRAELQRKAQLRLHPHDCHRLRPLWARALAQRA